MTVQQSLRYLLRIHSKAKMSNHRFPVKGFGTTVELQWVPLGEVEIVLSANLVSQVLIGLGSAFLAGGSWSLGVVLLVVALGVYGQFVVRKFRDWRKRRYPLSVIDQSTAGSGSSRVDFTVDEEDTSTTSDAWKKARRRRSKGR